jgi:hypothetical protein
MKIQKAAETVLNELKYSFTAQYKLKCRNIIGK